MTMNDISVSLPITPRVRTVVEVATALAAKLGHPVVDTRHLIYGMVAEGAGVAAVVLREFGLTDESVKAWIRASAPDDDLRRARRVDDDEALVAIGVDLAVVRERAREAFGEVLVTHPLVAPPRGEAAVDLLERAQAEATAIGNNYVGTEHLILAAAARAAGGSAGRLAELRVDVDAIRGRTLKSCRRFAMVAGDNPRYRALAYQIVELTAQVDQLDVQRRRVARPILEQLHASTSHQWARLYPNPTTPPPPDLLRQEFEDGVANAIEAARTELARAGIRTSAG